MTRMLCTLAVFAMALPLALSQDGPRVPLPATMRQNIAVVSAFAGAEPLMRKGSSSVPFCPPRTCLYYAGDYDSSNYNSNSLVNANDQGAGVVGQTWVGIKPSRNAIVTGVTFNQFVVNVMSGTNPTPFTVQVGIKPGQAGKTVCATSGNVTVKAYQRVLDSIIYSYTIKKLSKPCKLKKGTVYYVNLLPTYSDGYGYVVDVEDAKPANHRGWKNTLDDSYFNGAAFGANYQPAWGSSGACGGIGCDLFSIALTGKQGGK